MQASLPRLDRLKPRGSVGKSQRGRWRAVSLIAVHLVILAHLLHWKLSGETVSPVEPSEAAETLKLGYVNAGFLFFAAMILLTLVVGRFFCGWACHLVAYQDLCAWLLKKIGLRPRPVRSRLLLFVPFGIAAWMFFLEPLLARAEQPGSVELSWQLTRADFWRTFPGLWITVLTLLVDGFLIVYWLGGKGFCTYGCPYGAFFGVADRFSRGRIRVTDACETCGHCTATCSSNVRVHAEVSKHGMVVDPGCMKCLDCVSVCPTNALYFGYGKPALFTGSGKMGRSRADFSWSGELGLVVLFSGSFLALFGLYSYVSLLLAAGLAVLTAVFGAALWRLWRRPELVFQNRPLKAGGRLTTVGRIAAAGLVAWFAFVVHSGVVHVLTLRGQSTVAAVAEARAAVRRGETARLSDGEQHRLLLAGRDRLGLSRSLGLFGDPEVEWALSQVQQALIQFDPGQRDALQRRAMVHLRAAVALEPGWPQPALTLADRLMMQQDWPGTEAVLVDLVDRRPELPIARARLQHLRAIRAGRAGEFPEAERLLRELLEEQPDYEPARVELQRLEQVRDRRR